jgi:hypothetical protein
MSMTTNLVSAVNKAFSSLGDLVGELVVKSHTESYSVDTGIVTKTTQETTVDGVVSEYESQDVDGSVIQREDRRILIRHVEGLSIKIGDEIEDESGITYVVQDPKQIRPRDVTLLWDIRGRA